MSDNEMAGDVLYESGRLNRELDRLRASLQTMMLRHIREYNAYEPGIDRRQDKELLELYQSILVLETRLERLTKKPDVHS